MSDRSDDIPTWALVPGRTRDSGPRELSFERPAGPWVRLRLPLERDVYPRYLAAFRNEGGETLAQTPAVRVDASTVEVMVPATLLVPGTLDVLLSGAARASDWEAVDVYPLRIKAVAELNQGRQ